MTIHYETLKNWQITEVEQEYTVKDMMLYAQGLGLGQDPMDHDQLGYVYEDGLKALPTLAVVLGYPGETLRTEAWGTTVGSAASRVRAVERDVVVVNNGHADFTI
ncbi:hypothetical protein [Roseovarius amoyensis]|uniref:hypothetical protein n=1 Tax=Roseovarius amoyensis TaxID=2211448 RepID=UPI000DBE83B4|nr:hypothetical protein [Roseovarius amoyensis]